VTSLAEACSVTQPTMSGCIIGMERLGWVRREPGGTDRRVVSVRLTEDGVKVLHDLEEARTRVLLSDLESLPDADRAALAAALPALRSIITHHEQEKGR
jgi:DNA-binding MarR family transcriptional regulator